MNVRTAIFGYAAPRMGPNSITNANNSAFDQKPQVRLCNIVNVGNHLPLNIKAAMVPTEIALQIKLQTATFHILSLKSTIQTETLYYI